jgi:hypothetical protein
MNSQSFVNLSEAPPVVQVSVDTTIQPPPTAEQECIADQVFSPEQQHLAAAIMAMQLGVGLVHTLAAEADEALSDDEEPPLLKPKDATDPDTES